MPLRSQYDLLLVGAGLFNAIIAHEATKQGKRCLVVEKRNHIGGNLYCEAIEGINVQKYGAHIFHTSDREVWNYMNELCVFNHYVNSPIARYGDEIYNLPFNMNTFYRLWGTITPAQAQAKIEQQRLKTDNPRNCEEQALALVGRDLYEKLIKGYTEKQWGCDAKHLPAFIIRRIPIRFTYNNNYFDDPYQGIPIGGFNPIFEQCFSDCDVLLNTDFFSDRSMINLARTTVFSGMIDEYYKYCFGQLKYRSLRFENETLNMPDFQGNAVVNYTERETPYTRIIEHKHFEFGRQNTTVITREFPQEWHIGMEPYYPVNTEDNEILLRRYQALANRERNLHFGGRLGNYRYYNMDEIVKSALKLIKNILW